VTSIDDLKPHQQAKIAAAMYLAAVTEPLAASAPPPPPEPPPEPPPASRRQASKKPRGPVTVTVSLRALVVSYVLMFLISFAWVYATASSTFIHVAAVPLAVLVLIALAGLYAVIEFVWLRLVSRFAMILSSPT
jgi:hypothetical protein